VCASGTKFELSSIRIIPRDIFGVLALVHGVKELLAKFFAAENHQSFGVGESEDLIVFVSEYHTDPSQLPAWPAPNAATSAVEGENTKAFGTPPTTFPPYQNRETVHRPIE